MDGRAVLYRWDDSRWSRSPGGTMPARRHPTPPPEVPGVAPPRRDPSSTRWSPRIQSEERDLLSATHDSAGEGKRGAGEGENSKPIPGAGTTGSQGTAFQQLSTAQENATGIPGLVLSAVPGDRWRVFGLGTRAVITHVRGPFVHSRSLLRAGEPGGGRASPISGRHAYCGGRGPIRIDLALQPTRSP